MRRYDQEHQPDFAEFRDEMIAMFPKTPLVAFVVVGGGLSPDRYYGPFSNGEEAMDWLAYQPAFVKFRFLPLRNPYKRRKQFDFFSPETEVDWSEYDHTVRQVEQVQYENEEDELVADAMEVFGELTEEEIWDNYINKEEA